ncbi:hypothetical protein BmR1_04g09911 [Babesia microti strain RI]|uniref:Uncharacterized protein n=1 Tax=Babesia microti (strain RI) TaxID=1133968 RepID=A0A1N6LYI6_BABMR|nr:hypothetical protein BmR1_04g09911 [Babesia microti strain RI]SIO73931.1 hypothetical protein BmR1_04g09911 [Babesia microti strain RI]|eukprot:XP_021337977.1 hypothetical protein BmR1_04g09911 [Babesia microti strain RI]
MIVDLGLHLLFCGIRNSSNKLPVSMDNLYCMLAVLSIIAVRISARFSYKKCMEKSQPKPW